VISAGGDEVRTRFEHELITGLLRASHAFQPDNLDQWRFPAAVPRQWWRRVRDAALGLFWRCGFVRARRSGPGRPEYLTYVLDHLGELATFYQALDDAESRQLLIELLKYRILGRDHVRIPVADGYWKARASVRRKFLRQRHTLASPSGEPLDLYQVSGPSDAVQLHAHPLDLLNVFLLEQYAYRKGQGGLAARSGDIVIDGGGCWGDTALYFAERVGSGGMVHCFEFDPENLRILRLNLALNQGLEPRVRLVPSALWARSGERLPYSGEGPATSVAMKLDSGTGAVPTVALDDYVRELELPRVDFIKLDVEGAELQALQGAEATLRRFRPRLAVALYHRLTDFVDIPHYLEGLDLGYRLLLGHFTIHTEETVLFATADPHE
jgi:FkbM family methyltransferase